MGAIKLKSKNKGTFSVKLGVAPLSQANTSGLFLILFGLSFVAVSILMSLAFVDFKIQFFSDFNWEKLEEVPKQSKLALKYLFMISGMFFLAGFKVTVSGIQNFFKLQKRKTLEKKYKGQAWKYDFEWSSQWAHARDNKTSLLSHFVGISIVAGFHVILFKMVPFELPGIFIYLGMALFDVLIVYGFYLSGQRGRRAKPVKVSMPTFPLRLGNTYDLQLIGLQGFDINELEINLVCYQEVFSYKSNSNGQKNVQLKSLCEIKQIQNVSGGVAQFTIDLPENTELSSEVGKHPARFWNLHIYAACAGPNLDKHFLLPIY